MRDSNDTTSVIAVTAITSTGTISRHDSPAK